MNLLPKRPCLKPVDLDGERKPLEGDTRVGGGLACSVYLTDWPFSLFLQFQNENSG